MKISGKKRWVIVAFCALMAGVMVYVPFLRYSYYDQIACGVLGVLTAFVTYRYSKKLTEKKR